MAARVGAYWHSRVYREYPTAAHAVAAARAKRLHDPDMRDFVPLVEETDDGWAAVLQCATERELCHYQLADGSWHWRRES